MSRHCPALWAACPKGTGKQWAKERSLWIQEDVEEAFWRFKDQKWRDSLNKAEAKLQNMDQWQEARKRASESTKRQSPERPQNAPEAKVALASAEAPERPSKRCRFAGGLGCTGTHPLKMCKAFGDRAPEERKKIIKDN
jgi:hypothetical protein